METYEVDNGCKIFSWCPDANKEISEHKEHQTAYEQMEIIAKLPYVRHCAMMPDSHSGYDMPIGGVVSCDNVVVPNFVGKDIGCGVGLIRTSLHKSELEDEQKRKKILHSFSRSIPVGFNHNSQKRTNELKSSFEEKTEYIVDKTIGDISKVYNPIGDFRKEFASQLGTLGGG